MTSALRLCCAALALAAGSASAQTAATDSAPPVVAPADLTAEQFVEAAVVSNAFEIASSEVVLEAQARDEVRAFAERMIADHAAATAELTAAAEAAGVAAPAPYLDDRHEGMLTSLRDAEAGSLDDAYVEMQVNAHVEAVTLFSAYAERADPLGAFAEATLPKLEAHLEMARDLAAVD
jgi:putative membrane protein